MRPSAPGAPEGHDASCARPKRSCAFIDEYRVIDEHRVEYGIEPICRVLPIAPSTYYAHAEGGSRAAFAASQERRGVSARGHPVLRTECVAITMLSSKQINK
jgi:hypothetical protein